MKKLISMLLALTVVFCLAACGGNNTPATEAPTVAPTEAPTEAPVVKVEGTLEELLNKIVEKQPVEFMGGTLPIDLTDTSDDGKWVVKNYTGLDSADSITEAAFFEPMMGSIPYSMVAVRVADGADIKTVAEGMKNGIDQRKWICVEADDLRVSAAGDTVVLIMVGSAHADAATAASITDAFSAAAGGLDLNKSK